jgi:class 3 adenylate cyclase/tetratricopeptide (TPR) repeat protein
LATSAPEAYTPPHIARLIRDSRSAVEGERKLVTVLFVDLAGSTTIAERLGADTMHRVLERLFELALAEIHRYEGTVNQFLGDGLMALFGAPVAHEDHAERAVRAAIGVQRAIADHRADFRGADVQVRIGLNTGPVVVGTIGDNLRMDYTAVGDTTNLASRIQGLAEPGFVFASASTRELTADLFDWESLGTRSVKGRAEPVVVYRTGSSKRVRQGPEPTAHLAVQAPLLGRDHELAALRRAIHDAHDTGTGRVVEIVGEPGLGKSRLLEETRRAAVDDGVLWLEGRSLSFGATLSYWPFLDMLRRWLGVTEETPAAESAAILRTRLEAVAGGETDELIPYLAVMLGLPPEPALEDRTRFLDGQAMGLQLFRSVRRLVELLSATRTVVLAFEDLHWADTSTIELVAHLLPLGNALPIVYIGTSRPDADTPAAGLAELAREHHGERFLELRLHPLADGAGSMLIEHLLSGPAAADVRRRVIARVEGNPFFAMEVVRTLISTGAVVRDESTGQWRTTRALEAIDIPGSIHGVIAARIDRLDEDVKQTLKIASVIGRSFLYRVLAAVDDLDPALEANLAGLEELELVRERRRDPELEYVFAHALVQETTYDSILVERRQGLHHAVATAIETLFPDRLDEFAGVLAYHFTAAEAWDRAQYYLYRAGDQAGRMAGDTEAIARYQAALDAYAKAYGDRWEPLDRAVLERKVGEALFGKGDYDAADEHLMRALQLLGAPFPARAEFRRKIGSELIRQTLRHPGGRRLGMRRRATEAPVLDERCRIYYLIAWMDIFRDQERLPVATLQAFDTAERGASPRWLARSAMSMGFLFDAIGWKATAGRYLRFSQQMADELDNPVARGDAANGLAWHDVFAGRLADGHRTTLEAARWYEMAGDLHNWGASVGVAMEIERYQGELGQLLDNGAQLLKVGEETGDTIVRGWGQQTFGFVPRLLGDLDAAVEGAEAALAIFRSIPSHGSIAVAISDLAAIRMAQGDVVEAVRLYREAVAVLDAHSLRHFEAAWPRSGLAGALLSLAEQAATTSAREESLAEAEAAAKLALAHAKVYRPGIVKAARVAGTARWLRGDARNARSWWDRGLAEARSMGTRLDEADVLLEVGRRTEDAEVAATGARLMTEILASPKRDVA